MNVMIAEKEIEPHAQEFPVSNAGSKIRSKSADLRSGKHS